MTTTSETTFAEVCVDCLPATTSEEPPSSAATASTSSITTTQAPAIHAEPSSTASSETPVETFVAPPITYPSIIIEFCDRCRWAPRATWVQTELFLTFPNPLLRSITLQPLNAPETGGRFRVWLDGGVGKGYELVWDRKTEGGFPELKVLKQRIRNIIQPDMGLGHSDKHGKNGPTI
ncbi:selenoprotein W-related protein, partial [Tremellales sp. Uapishka_1]